MRRPLRSNMRAKQLGNGKLSKRRHNDFMDSRFFAGDEPNNSVQHGRNNGWFERRVVVAMLCGELGYLVYVQSGN